MTNVAPFSSRGMSTWSLLEGIGHMKPDLLTAGSMIYGLSISNNSQGQPICTLNSGTSVSASIITASIALTLSAFEKTNGREQRLSIQNTAFIKQALIRSAKRLKGLSITEQGAGVFDLEGFFSQINSKQSKKQVMIYPYKMDFRSSGSVSNTNSLS